MPRKIYLYYFIISIFLLFLPAVKVNASFIDDLLSGLKQNNIPADVNNSNDANLPGAFQGNIQVPQIDLPEASPSSATVKGISNTADNSSIVESVKGYTVQSGLHQPASESKVNNVLDILIDFFKDLFSLNNKGKESASITLESMVPPGVIISDDDKEMSKAFPKEQCINSPGIICPGDDNPFDNIKPTTPTPTSDGNLVGTPTPNPTQSSSCNDPDFNQNLVNNMISSNYNPANCTLGTGPCEVCNLLPYFSNDLDKAVKASLICQRESGSDPFSDNLGCLDRTMDDYSIGLFQINFLYHFPEYFSHHIADWDNKIFECAVDETKRSLLDQKVADFHIPDTSIRYANQIGNMYTSLVPPKSFWTPWSTAAPGVCNISDLPVVNNDFLLSLSITPTPTVNTPNSGNIKNFPMKNPQIYYSQADAAYRDSVNYDTCQFISGGCGPSVLSMILSNYIDPLFDPQTSVNRYYADQRQCYSPTEKIRTGLLDNGFTADYLFTYYSGGSQTQKLNDMRQGIGGGNQIVALANFITQSGRTIPHFIWITDMDDSGEIYTMDSYFGYGMPYPLKQSEIGSCPVARADRIVRVDYLEAFIFRPL